MGLEGLQIRTALAISSRGKKITNRGKEISDRGERNFKLEQRLQIGAEQFIPSFCPVFMFFRKIAPLPSWFLRLKYCQGERKNTPSIFSIWCTLRHRMRQTYAPIKVTKVKSDDGHKDRELRGAKRSPEPALRRMDFRASKTWIFPALIKAWQSLHNFKHVNITDVFNARETKKH